MRLCYLKKRGKKIVVLFFYISDAQADCQAQLADLRDVLPKFEQANAVVFGINKSSEHSRALAFERNRLNFPLLGDEEMQVAALYDAVGRAVL
jgi:thioredoxin-dependent peroxiredoxin